MNLWVFGGSGMLGSEVVALAKEKGYDVWAPSHSEFPLEIERVWEPVEKPDVIINCAGSRPGGSLWQMTLSNGYGPHGLAALGIPLIHMSTDCVFSGRHYGSGRRRYLSKDDPVEPVEFYGRSKLLGEPRDSHVTVVRGSFIGRRHGFFKWITTTREPVVEGWMNAYWNGGTATQIAETLLTLAEDPPGGVLHVAAEEAVPKAWMVEYIADKLDFHFSIRIVPEPRIWRALEPDIILPPVKYSLDQLCEEIM